MDLRTEAQMPTYIFACTHDTSSETVQRDCQGREQAVQYARRYLEQALQEADLADAPASVTVAEEHRDAEPRWLGSWDWSAQDGWVWTPLE
jgi:hypothetical protein